MPLFCRLLTTLNGNPKKEVGTTDFADDADKKEFPFERVFTFWVSAKTSVEVPHSLASALSVSSAVNFKCRLSVQPLITQPRDRA